MHQLEPWAMIPFVLMLLSIAVMPLAAGKWWQSNLHKLYVSFALAIAAGYYGYDLMFSVEHIGHDVKIGQIDIIFLLVTHSYTPSRLQI